MKSLFFKCWSINTIDHIFSSVLKCKCWGFFFWEQVYLLSLNYALLCWNRKQANSFVCVYTHAKYIYYIYTFDTVYWLFVSNYRAVGEIVMLLKLVGTLISLYRGFYCVWKERLGTMSSVPYLSCLLVWDKEAWKLIWLICCL